MTATPPRQRPSTPPRLPQEVLASRETTPPAPLRRRLGPQAYLTAIRQSEPNEIRRLADAGVDVNTPLKASPRSSGGWPLRAVDPAYESVMPFLVAAALADVEVVQALLDVGASPNSVNRFNQNALHVLSMRPAPQASSSAENNSSRCRLPSPVAAFTPKSLNKMNDSPTTPSTIASSSWAQTGFIASTPSAFPSTPFPVHSFSHLAPPSDLFASPSVALRLPQPPTLCTPFLNRSTAGTISRRRQTRTASRRLLLETSSPVKRHGGGSKSLVMSPTAAAVVGGAASPNSVLTPARPWRRAGLHSPNAASPSVNWSSPFKHLLAKPGLRTRASSFSGGAACSSSKSADRFLESLLLARQTGNFRAPAATTPRGTSTSAIATATPGSSSRILATPPGKCAAVAVRYTCPDWSQQMGKDDDDDEDANFEPSDLLCEKRAATPMKSREDADDEWLQGDDQVMSVQLSVGGQPLLLENISPPASSRRMGGIDWQGMFGAGSNASASERETVNNEPITPPRQQIQKFPFGRISDSPTSGCEELLQGLSTGQPQGIEDLRSVQTPPRGGRRSTQFAIAGDEDDEERKLENVAKLLVCCGTEVVHRDKFGWLPIDYATHFGHAKVAAVLTESAAAAGLHVGPEGSRGLLALAQF